MRIAVGDPWDCIPEFVFLLQPRVAHFLHELVQPTGVPSTFTRCTSLLLGSTPLDPVLPCPVGTIPRGSSIGFSSVQLNPHHVHQLLPNQVVQKSCPCWRRQDVHVVRKGEQFLAIQHLPLRFFQCIVDGETEQEGHQRIPLLSSFMLLDCPTARELISPHVAWLEQIERTNGNRGWSPGTSNNFDMELRRT